MFDFDNKTDEQIFWCGVAMTIAAVVLFIIVEML